MQVRSDGNNIKERPGYAEAREELTILERLAQHVWVAIGDFGKRPNFIGDPGEVELEIHDARQSLLKGFRELAQHCYGRTVIGSKIDEDQKTTTSFKFRITQANVSQLDCGIIGRNSPAATKLVSAQVGDEREINKDGTQYFKVKETRTFEGPTSLHLSSERPDFRRMTVLGGRAITALAISGLRAFVEDYLERDLSEAARSSLRPGALTDPTWIEDWAGIYLGDSDNQSLGHQFFTRTTQSQEAALNKPHGLTIVEGIAGAGKTSVALGRLKFFSNFATGENTEYYGLENAPKSDFSPAGMIGFVLSRSLRRYLEDTAHELELEHLPIRDFQEHRTHLSNRFGLTRSFRRGDSLVPACRTQLNWLRAIDAAIARSIAAKMEDVISTDPAVAVSVKEAVRGICSDLRKAEPSSGSASFHLSGLAQKLVDSTLSAEYRAREASIRRRSTQAEFTDRVDLEKELRQARQEEERGVVTPLVRQLLGLLDIEPLFADAVNSVAFVDLVEASFGGEVNLDIRRSVDEIRSAFVPKKENERRTLTDSDLLVLIACAAMIADEFEYLNAPGHIYRVRRHTAVFIDEVQDFTEIEVFLMGMSALKQYHQITLSGDLCQRLQRSGSKIRHELFPSVPRSSRNEPIFLDKNFRQREPLACLSAGFRNVLQGDARLSVDFVSQPPALLHRYARNAEIDKVILERLASIDEYATVAIITPTEDDAAQWHARLNKGLAGARRLASLSRREDLTARFDIHFTHVYETKGLEFDVVIIPDLGSFELGNEIGQNEAYVALSRAKHALFIGCSKEKDEVVSILIDKGLVSVVDV